MLNHSYRWVGHARFREENFREWLSNYVICEDFLPQKFPIIRYMYSMHEVLHICYSSTMIVISFSVGNIKDVS